MAIDLSALATEADIHRHTELFATMARELRERALGVL